jgi:hypothetical protein
LFVFLYKIREEEGGTSLAWSRGEKMWYQWEGRGSGKVVGE